MGFETAYLHKEIELDCVSDGLVTVNWYTDLPGDRMALRHSETFDTALVHRAVRIRLPGTVLGRLHQLELVPSGRLWIYSPPRVWAKPLAGTQAWRWYPVPIEQPASDAWIETRLPIEPTPEGWAEARLPIEPTPEAWAETRLPIEPTPEGWQGYRLPIPDVSKGWDWAPLPVEDETP